MAHGWDSYFHNLPPLSPDPSTLRTTEPEGSLSQHENYSGHHDFPNSVASHEASAANNTTFSSDCYPNPSIGNSNSDCLYERYKETPWQVDGEQTEKYYLPKCVNGDVEFTTDGLSTSESFPTSYPANLQGLKQDCGILTASFLEDCSDISSCSDADETRPSCELTANNSFPNPNIDVSIEHTSTEWLFTHTGNLEFTTEHPCTNVSEAEIILQSSSNVMAEEKIVQWAPNKMGSPQYTSDMVTSIASETVEDQNDYADYEDGKVKDNEDSSLTQGEYSNISLSGQENLIAEGLEKCSDDGEKDVITTASSIMTILDNNQEDLNDKQLFDQENEDFSRHLDSTACEDESKEEDKGDILKGEFEDETLKKQKSHNLYSPDGQDEIMRKKQGNSEIFKGERKKSASIGIEKFEYQKSQTSNFTNVQKEYMMENKKANNKVPKRGRKKSSKLNERQKSHSPHSTDGQNEITKEEQKESEFLKGKRKESCSLENENFERQKSPNPKSTDGQNEKWETDSQERQIQTNTSQSSDPLCITVFKCKDPGHELTKSTSTWDEPSIISHSESCLEQNHLNKDDTYREKQWTIEAEKTNALSYPDSGPSGLSNDSLSIDASKKNKQNMASLVESRALSYCSSTVPSPCIEQEITRKEKAEKKTLTSTNSDCSNPAMTTDNIKQSVQRSLKLCLQSDTSCTDMNPSKEKEWTSPAQNTNSMSSPDDEQSLHQSPVVLAKSLCGNILENARESFEEVDMSTEEPSMFDVLYGEPLSREDSSCDTDRSKRDTSQYEETSLTRPDRNSINHSEGQAPQLLSSIQMRKVLQPVVILKALESLNSMSNSYHCTGCQYKTHNVDGLIEHHHCSHSVCSFQYCKTCNLYLMRNEQAEKHFCGIVELSPQFPVYSRPQKRRKNNGRNSCFRCKLTFPKFYQYIKHMRIHTGKTPYQCNGCGLYFSQSASLRRHKRIPGRCKQTTSPVTNPDTVINENQMTPQKDETQSNPYAKLPECYVKLVDVTKANICAFCGKSFSTAKKAKKHFYNAHSQTKLLVPANQSITKLDNKKSLNFENDTKEKYKCPFCPRFFKYSYNRARHLRICVKNLICGGKDKVSGKFRCPLCDTKFTLSSNRYRHINTFCLRQFVNRLAKEVAKSRKKSQHKTSKEAEQTTNSKEAEQKINSQEAEQKIHSQEAEQKIHSQEAEQKIHSQEAEQKIHSQEAEQKIHSQEAEQKIPSEEPEQKIRSEEPEQKIRSKEPEQKIRSIEPEQKIRSIEPEQKIRSIEPEQKIRSKEPEQKIRSKEPEQKIRSKEPEQKIRSIEPEQKKRSKEPEQKKYSFENEQTQSKENEQEMQEPPALTDKIIPRYKCNVCPAVFCHASGKYRHMKKHELFKLTGKMFKYRNSIFSIMSKPATSSSTTTDERTDNMKQAEANSSAAMTCNFCGKCFDTSQSLKKHERSHKSERPYRCQDCGKGFKKRAYLIGHKNVHQRRIQCTVCRKILPTIRELIQHRSSHLKRGMLKCPDCHMQFQFPAHLLRHVETHKKKENKATQLEEKTQRKPQQAWNSVKVDQSGPKQLQCSLCKEVCDDAHVLRKHCLAHISGSSSNQCPFCQHNFSNRRNLLRHMTRHTGQKPFSCSTCGKQFYRYIYLQLHSEHCLPAQLIAMQSDTKKKGIHHSLYFPWVFTKKMRLKSYHHGHKINSLLLCAGCGQYFGHRKLSQHQKNCVRAEVNTGSSPNSDLHKSTSQISLKVPKVALKSSATKMFEFKCTHCTQRFRYRSLLLRHLVSHTGLQPYACVHCGHRFRSRTMCLQHEAFCDGVYKEEESNVKSNAAKQFLNVPQAEGEAEYKCKFCTKTFMKPRNLRRHILTHNEVKPYRCKACDSCFSRYDHLNVHQTRCRGTKTRLEVCIPKISLDDVGKGWQIRFGFEAAKKPEKFDCEVCSRSYSTQSKLSRHNTMFHTAKLFKCAVCGSSFAHKKSLQKHSKMSRCRKVSIETRASPPLGTDPSLENVTEPLDVVRDQIIRRIQPHFNRKLKYICSYCPRAFGNGYQLVVHTRLHTGERPYPCDDCGQRFIRKDYLQRHFLKCTKKRPQNEVLCDKCGGFFSQDKLENHKNSCILTSSSANPPVSQSQQSPSKSPPKGFSCAYCSFRFLLFSQLQEHFLNAHKMETMTPPVSTVPLQHHLSNIPKIKEEPLDQSCDNCLGGEANSIHKPDTAHERKDPNPYTCPECNMSFLSKAGLTGHLRVHTREVPFSCKTCKKGFWNKSLLRNHYRKCRFGRFAENHSSQELEVPLKAEIDLALNDSVLVFKEGSKATGTGVLQTNFSCKEDFVNESQKNSEGKEVQSNSNNEKKTVQYQCSECEKTFTDGLMLISHLEDHGREEQERKCNTCIKCGRVCSSQIYLEKHMKMHGVNKKFPCSECPKLFYTPSDLKVHKKCHDLNSYFVCKLCTLRFQTRLTLCSHYREDHPDDVFACRFCNKPYVVKKSLYRHYKKWHQKQQKEHGSTVQEKRSAEKQSSSQVSTTGKSDEDESNNIEDSDSDSAPYFPCHVCGKTFPTSESLEDHQRCHLGEKPHECAECGRCFFQASQLQQHQRMHKSEFQCQACGRGFVSLFALRKHKHTHGKSRPYRCTKCHLSFTGPIQLAEHMSTHREENFPCDICNRVFLSKSSRAEHRKSHSKSGDNHSPSVFKEEYKTATSISERSFVLNKKLKYRCGVCNERFKNPEKLSEHGCIAAKERPYSCLDCNKHFLHASHLKKHSETHQVLQSKSQYPCNQCNNSFSSSEHFLTHLKSHVSAAVEIKCKTEDGVPSHGFVCPVCPQYFATATELIGHFTMHSEGSLECKVCKRTFSSQSHLEEHEHCHLTSATQFECTVCGQSFSGTDAFRQHRCSRQQHTKMENKCSNPLAKISPPNYQAPGEEEEIDVTGVDLYYCPSCSMQFSSKSGLLAHQNKHQREKPFKCELCGKTFALRRYLKEHQRRHCQKSEGQNTTQSAQNMFSCTQCGWEFDTSQALSVHLRFHAEKEVGDLRCDMCYRSFSSWSLLKQHQESHVGQVVYECNECDKAFAFPHLLDEHQLSHATSSL